MYEVSRASIWGCGQALVALCPKKAQLVTPGFFVSKRRQVAQVVALGAISVGRQVLAVYHMHVRAVLPVAVTPLNAALCRHIEPPKYKSLSFYLSLEMAKCQNRVNDVLFNSATRKYQIQKRTQDSL